MSERRSIIRWFGACAIVPLLAVALSSLPTAQTLAATTYTVYNSPQNGQPGDIDGSEIIDITPNNQYAVVVGSRDLSERRLYMATLTPNTGIVVSQIDLDAAVNGRGLTNPLPSSVAIHPTGDYALVTIREGGAPANTATETAGLGVFVTIADNGALSLVTDPVLTLGIRPESIDISNNGEFAVVANEGSNGIANSGSISIIDLDASGAATGSVVQNITPPNETNPDPESVAISLDGQRAFVTLETSGNLVIVDINSPLNTSTATTVDVPSSSSSLPDGIAVTPDGQYVITANEGTNRVNMFQVSDAGPTLTLVDNSESALPATSTPEMVAIGTIGGELRAFVTLEAADSVAVFKLDPAGADKLVFETLISLNPSGQPPADGPEGIAVANGRELIVTANAFSNNISVIVSDTPSPSPSPSPSVSPSPSPSPSTPPGLSKRAWLPIIRP
ncbi:MAG TPA: beta-propeller fold lactonase family protein [Herpetosiphonaceae bacterium]